MTRDYVIDAFGARWSLDTTGIADDARDRLHVLWEWCRVPSASSGDDGVEPFVVTDADPYAVSRAITIASLRRRVGSAVLLHSAGFSVGDRAVALVGPSGTGKSTAARTLGQHFGYLSDETIAIEPDGRIAPYPKPISTVVDPARRWVKDEHSPRELGLREAGETAYLHALVVLERDPAHEVPELAELTLADALLAVTKESSSMPLVERPLHRLATLASGAGGPYVLRYNEIGDCVELIRDLFSTDAGRFERQPWTSTPGAATSAPATLPTDAETANWSEETRIARAPWTDAVHAEGGTVVLQGTDLMRLGPVGEVAWVASASPITVTDLLARVIAELGEHPDAARIVDEGLRSMVDSGILRVA
ncbi:hypothetical protein [Knoellia subterranea]|uniref:Uncharacterized protein n=1 Tax=Knoellia subterranea KCTC 19937 TaxID=1385521 RepID=A0A0A0JLI3_9MICO|nr:hypothetical protein [Knoellia subterranea]KGN37609.1 hypothetical protein N803_14420 [Knoellia subterranea KCTC 19937]